MSAMGGDNNPTMGPEQAAGDERALATIVAAHNEADRVGETVGALRGAFPGARVWVADDASTDGTAEAAMLAGAEVVRRGKSHGKGGNVSAAAEAALSVEPAPRIVLLCDGDLGASAARLAPLVQAVEQGECDLAVASFSRRVGGGFGLALGFAHWAIKRLCG
ncbi:MAG TPA: glycosyltransferase, partial [Solirubrobacterales bacterium]|nr:glycosyltransferase [Solirubrobacterales bacterium]